MHKRTNRFNWLISFGHSFVLLAISFAFTYTSYTFINDRLVIKLCSIIKRVAFNIGKDIPQKDYLFVDLRSEKALIPLEDGSGNEVITDRARLASFFGIIKRHQHDVRFTLCDVFLQGHSVNDSALYASVSGIKNIVFPVHLDNDGHIQPIIMPVPHAIADYNSDDEFFKFKLFQNDTLPTIPVYMYQQLTNKNISGSGFLRADDNGPVLNSVIIDYPIRTHELFDEGKFTVVKLADLLSLPEDVVAKDYLKGRIIIMGDFKGDIHQTFYGPLPGAIILLNIYLSLGKGNWIIFSVWILILIAAFTALSHYMFFPKMQRKIEKAHKKLPVLFKSFIFLSILSAISYLIFGLFVEVLVLTFYLNFIRSILEIHHGHWTLTTFKKQSNKIFPKPFHFKIK